MCSRLCVVNAFSTYNISNLQRVYQDEHTVSQEGSLYDFKINTHNTYVCVCVYIWTLSDDIKYLLEWSKTDSVY